MTTNRYLFLILLCLICAFVASCTTPAETSGAAIAIGTGLGAIVKAVSPALDAAHQQQVVEAVGKAQSWIDVLQQGVGALANTIANHSSEVAALKAQVAQQSEQIANAPTTAQVYAASGVGAAVATGTSRAMSVVKHGFSGKKAA